MRLAASVFLAVVFVCATLLPDSPAEACFLEAFGDSTKVLEWVQCRGDWVIRDGAMYQEFAGYTSPPDMNAYLGSYAGTVYLIEADVAVVSDNGCPPRAIGVLFRVQDCNAFYYVYLGHSGEVALAKYVSGSWHLLHSQYFDPLPIGVSRHLRIENNPTEIRVYTDGVFRYAASVPAEFLFGSVGFMTGWGSQGRFDNLKVLDEEGPTPVTRATWGSIKALYSSSR